MRTSASLVGIDAGPLNDRHPLINLRFEHRAGKFSEADYEEIKQSLEIEAARVLADMDTLTGSAPTPATRQAASEKGRRT